MNKTPETRTIAQIIADSFGHPDREWESPDGDWLEDVCECESRVVLRYPDGCRYSFPDGSSIVVGNVDWDFGFDGCTCACPRGGGAHVRPELDDVGVPTAEGVAALFEHDPSMTTNVHGDYIQEVCYQLAGRPRDMYGCAIYTFSDGSWLEVGAEGWRTSCVDNVNIPTIAERLASYVGGDGRVWETPEGEHIPNVFSREASEVIMDGWIERFEFADGSSIVCAGDAWDIGFDDTRCFCFAGGREHRCGYGEDEDF